MLVKDLMTPVDKVIRVSTKTSIIEVAELLHLHGFSGIPVVNNENIVAGMINERDFLVSKYQIYLPTYIKLLSEMTYAQGGHAQVPYVTDQMLRMEASEVMNQHVFFARPEMTIEEVTEIFSGRGNNPLVVVDNQNKLVGIIARSDLLKSMVTTTHIKNFDQITIPKDSRKIDREVQYVIDDFKSHFSYVTKFRVNTWLTVAIVFFILGFIAGNIFLIQSSSH